MNLFEETLRKNTPCDLIDYETLKECPSKLKNSYIKNGSFTIKAPVILSVFEVEIDIKADLVLEEPASDILRLSNDVFLERCILIPLANKLFLSGIIRESIEYAPWENSEGYQSVPVRQCVFSIPFKCVTKVEYLTPPHIYTNLRDGLCSSNVENMPESSHIKYNNEKILCELVSSEFDCEYCKKLESIISDEPYIHKLEENICMKINLKLIQNQDIEISSSIR